MKIVTSRPGFFVVTHSENALSVFGVSLFVVVILGLGLSQAQSQIPREILLPLSAVLSGLFVVILFRTLTTQERYVLDSRRGTLAITYPRLLSRNTVVIQVHDVRMVQRLILLDEDNRDDRHRVSILCHSSRDVDLPVSMWTFTPAEQAELSRLLSRELQVSVSDVRR